MGGKKLGPVMRYRYSSARVRPSACAGCTRVSDNLVLTYFAFRPASRGVEPSGHIEGRQNQPHVRGRFGCKCGIGTVQVSGPHRIHAAARLLDLC